MGQTFSQSILTSSVAHFITLCKKKQFHRGSQNKLTKCLAHLIKNVCFQFYPIPYYSCYIFLLSILLDYFKISKKNLAKTPSIAKMFITTYVSQINIALMLK